jgi:hypothetical protein
MHRAYLRVPFGGGSMRNFFVVMIASLVAISVAGCAGKGKVPVGKGKEPVVHTKG